MALLDRHFTIVDVRNCPMYGKGDLFTLKGLALHFGNDKPTCLFLARSITETILTEIENKETMKNREYNCPGCSGLIKFVAEGSQKYRTMHMQMLAAAERRRRMQQMGPLVGLLSTFSFFRALEEDSLKEIIDCTVMRKFEAGETILRRGQPGKFLYILTSGKVTLLDPDGNSIAYLGMGEIFGEMSLLSGNPVSATIRAAEPVKVLMISNEKLQHILIKYPFLQAAFTRLLVQRLAGSISGGHSDAAPGGFGGQLADISAPELFQMFHENMKSGVIDLQLAGGPARVAFVDGEIVEAAYRGLAGVAAFNAILPDRRGSFRFSSDLPEATRSQPAIGGFMKLLMDGLRQLDEKGG